MGVTSQLADFRANIKLGALPGPDRASALAEAVLSVDAPADVSAVMRHSTPLTAARMAGE